MESGAIHYPNLGSVDQIRRNPSSCEWGVRRVDHLQLSPIGRR